MRKNVPHRWSVPYFYCISISLCVVCGSNGGSTVRKEETPSVPKLLTEAIHHWGVEQFSIPIGQKVCVVFLLHFDYYLWTTILYFIVTTFVDVPRRTATATNGSGGWRAVYFVTCHFREFLTPCQVSFLTSHSVELHNIMFLFFLH